MALKIGIGRDVPSFRVMDVINRANARQLALPPDAPRLLRMEVGQPGTGLPEGARRAVANALQAGEVMGYTEALGRRTLRERLSAHIHDWYGTTIAPERIAVTLRRLRRVFPGFIWPRSTRATRWPSPPPIIRLT